MDGSVRGGDFSWPCAGTFIGHKRGPHISLSARLESDYAPQPSVCSVALISRSSSSATSSRSCRPASTLGR